MLGGNNWAEISQVAGHRYGLFVCKIWADFMHSQSELCQFVADHLDLKFNLKFSSGLLILITKVMSHESYDMTDLSTNFVLYWYMLSTSLCFFIIFDKKKVVKVGYIHLIISQILYCKKFSPNLDCTTKRICVKIITTVPKLMKMMHKIMMKYILESSVKLWIVYSSLIYKKKLNNLT